MIEIKNKKDCCGCGACVQICPKQCISMAADNEGFLYPEVDTDRCIHCNLCTTICPTLNAYPPQAPLATYAAVNKDKATQEKSSSGGLFSLLAQTVINDGGVVFGAAFNADWQVEHSSTESIEGVTAFRSSKYVQSSTRQCYTEARALLDTGRKVLFSGTPCQIAGLKHFLRAEYDNLLTIEVVCHGTPSPMVWSDFLVSKRKEIERINNGKEPAITHISFRDKSTGWENYHFSIDYKSGLHDAQTYTLSEPHQRNTFMRGFLHNYTLRPSCYHCVARKRQSRADITLADYWGVQQYHTDIYNDKGVSLAIINTVQGKHFFDRIQNNIHYTPSSYGNALAHNMCIEKSVEEPPLRQAFWEDYQRKGIAAINDYCKHKKSLLKRIIHYFKNK